MRRLSTLLLCALCHAPVVGAPLGQVNIELRATVINYSCTVAAQDSDKTVQLGRWATRDLGQPGGRTRAIPFSISLTGCPPASQPAITFVGRSASAEPALLALNDNSSAKNVAVELLNSDRTPLAINRTPTRVKASEQGDAVLTFFARYASLGAPQPGTADADATLTIDYQ
ncbi:fimbrial protein [Pantoea sp. 1.19]|uniref:fimbrial protein n=1 Tax=Pantoea sp. 1.19 TaxID=1925589 RepID=UPI000948CF5D|nr:fimbrial protein [Pantoea sp. 1.19]